MVMRWRSYGLVGVAGLVAAVLPVGGTAFVDVTPAGAVSCDTYAAGTSTVPTAVTASPAPIAPSGSLAASSTVTVTMTATDSAGHCVSGAPIYLSFTGPGSADTDIADKCDTVSLSLTANWTQCATDGSGQVTVVYETPSTLPNGGTSNLEATTQPPASVPPPPQTSYTYASMNVTAENITATEGIAFTAQVGTMTYSNGNHTPQATIDWGDGTTSAGLLGGTGNFAISGTHTYAEEKPSGYAVTVTGFVGDGPTVTSTASAGVADAPLSATGTPLSGRAHHALSVVVATFSDADPHGTIADYQATVSWGDGSTSSGSLSASASGFSVSASHTYTRRGTYTVNVGISDTGGAITTAQSSVSIR